jgi:diguanylate cyclase (GGDEF)-like protein
MRLSALRPTRPAAAIQPDLLAGVFATLMPAAIMTGLFLGVGAVVLRQLPSPLLALFYGGGTAAGVARLGIMARHRDRFDSWPAAEAVLRAVSRQFAASYLAFAGFLGAFAGSAAWIGDTEMVMLAAVLVTGYAAGVSTGVASQPEVAVPAMVAGVLPVIAGVAARGDGADLALAAMMLAFLVGGIRSTLVRYEALVREFDLRHAYARLARLDPLTGLPNRLAVDEKLTELQQSGQTAAIYCIDLDGFKKINDFHGHLAGDALLVEVGRRLRQIVRSADMVARLGGDEFMLICEAADEAGRAALAERIVTGGARPYGLRDRLMIVGASVGVAVLTRGAHVEAVKAAADDRLYRAKRARVGDAPMGSRRDDGS